MFRRSPLPNIPIFTLTWSISDVFGGITSSAVQRTSSFAQSGHKHVELLTLDPDTNADEKKKQLVAQGWLDKRVRMRNIWSDLRQTSDRNLSNYQGNLDEPVAIANEEIIQWGGELKTERRNAKNKIVQTDYFRPDGSIMVSDRHDLGKTANHNGRVITLFNRQGSQVTQWTNASEFYYSWMDNLTKGKPAILITDSPGIGGRFRNYDRPNIVKSQVLHNFHLSNPRDDINSPIDPKWKNIIVNSDKYDVLAVLTEGQKKDLSATQLNPGNLFTVSNMFRGGLEKDLRPRLKTKGIQVSRLAPEKQVDHSIRAVSQNPDVTLDVYGFAYKPSFEQGLRDLIATLSVTDRITLRGYDRNAKEYFKYASFSLLPSLFEGQGLVVIESMASGCIPIAYDIKYGPASIIEHGVDGFLVPAGNVEKLAETIRHVVGMDEGALMAMRTAAVAKAEQYQPKKIVARWGEVLSAALSRKQETDRSKLSVSLAAAAFEGDVLKIDAVLAGAGELPEWAGLSWKSRKHDLYGRVRAEAIREGASIVLSGSIPGDRFSSSFEDIFDIFLDVRVSNVMRRLRLGSKEEDIPPANGMVKPYNTVNNNFSVEVAI